MNLTSPTLRFGLLAALGSLVLLSGAFAFQAFGYAPCKLCLWQRWPHGVAIFIGAVLLVLPRRELAWLGAIAALTTAAIGLYHAGVEQHWWQGPSSCTGVGTGEITLEAIMAAPLVRCDEIAWSLLGISMAGWNALISLALALLWVKAALAKTR